MAYTNIGENGKVKWGKGDGGGPLCYFHFDDIRAIMNQPDAEGLAIQKAIVDGKHCDVIFGVKGLKKRGFEEPLKSKNHVIALSCPKARDKKGGRFVLNPKELV